MTDKAKHTNYVRIDGNGERPQSGVAEPSTRSLPLRSRDGSSLIHT